MSELTFERPIETTNGHVSDVQIAPGVFLPGPDFDVFMDHLESDPEALTAYLDMVKNINQRLVENETVDEVLWDTFAPIFQHFNWQQRLNANDLYAWQVALACGLYQQHRETTHRVRSFAVNFGQ